MSNLHQWIIVIQIVLNSSGALFAGDDREHVHIKVHIPEMNSKHTHLRKVKNHVVHPKKVVKKPDMTNAEMDMAPFAMMSYGMMDQPQPMPLPMASFPMSLPAMPDMPSYGVDNTLEASIMKKPNMKGMSQMMNEAMFTKFHGMKKPSEFLGARPADDVPKYGIDDDLDDDSYLDDYDTKSAEAMVVDQRVAGSTYPYSMGMSGLMKPKWSSYSNIFESSMKPYSVGMKYASLTPDWMGATTEDDYSMYERYPSPTTMHIAKARPLTSSRMKFEQHSYERDPYSELRTVSKKKKSRPEKRNRTPSSGFRINY